MSLKERIAADLTAAMKARSAERLGVVRMLKSRLQEAEVHQRASKGPTYILDDQECLAAIAAYAKQRRDSIDAYGQAGRQDLVAKETAELRIIEEYLPAQLSEEEVRCIVAEAVAEAGATSARDMGAVMKLVMPRVKGAADGAVVSRLVREKLG